MNYLPGQNTDYRIARSRSAGPALLLLALAFIAAWYVVPKFLPTHAAKVEPNKTASAVPMASAEDLQHHIDLAETALAAAVQNVRRCQESTRRVLPALERDYLVLERGRLQNADQSSEAAHRAIEQARQELELAKNLITERTIK